MTHGPNLDTRTQFGWFRVWILYLDFSRLTQTQPFYSFNFCGLSLYENANDVIRFVNNRFLSFLSWNHVIWFPFISLLCSLSEPIDVYIEWLDECERVNNFEDWWRISLCLQLIHLFLQFFSLPIWSYCKWNKSFWFHSVYVNLTSLMIRMELHLL